MRLQRHLSREVYRLEPLLARVHREGAVSFYLLVHSVDKLGRLVCYFVVLGSPIVAYKMTYLEKEYL